MDQVPDSALRPAKPSSNRGALISWAIWDWANNPFPTLVQTFVFAAYFTRTVAADEATGTALWGNMVGISALIVALGGPMLGAVADQTGRRKPWIAGFTWLCCLAAALLWFIKPNDDYVWPALVLVALGILGAEYATIFYNAMLPRLASPERLGRWSGWGWAMGYAGGLACLIVALVVFVQPDPAWFGLDRSEDKAEHVRATFLLAAVWFAVFSVPLLLFTPDTPATGKRFGRAAIDGFKQLWDSFQHVRRYTNILRFLIARMVYTDGLATMFSFGGVFAAGAFNMNESQILMFGIALNITAGLGAAGFAWIDDKLGSKNTIIISLICLILSATGMLLVRSQSLFWVFGLILGIFVGPVQAASRSLMARLAPQELRNQMFGLYAFSGKATSFLGPMLVGWITLWSGSQRVGMASIIVLLTLGFILILPVKNPMRRPLT